MGTDFLDIYDLELGVVDDLSREPCLELLDLPLEVLCLATVAGAFLLYSAFSMLLSTSAMTYHDGLLILCEPLS
jgi:hypothetical protein